MTIEKCSNKGESSKCGHRDWQFVGLVLKGLFFFIFVVSIKLTVNADGWI